MTEKQAVRSDHKHPNMERFLKVCLMVLLYDDVGYGYGLMEGLSFFGFSEDQLNVSTLYRTLRKMEKEKLLASNWEIGGPGPKKRVYSLTENGKKELKQWIYLLNDRKTRIEKLINRYNEKKQNDSFEDTLIKARE